MAKKPKAKLTPAEDRLWVKAFEFALNDGKSEAQADREAWREVQAAFPRLKQFSGALPNPMRRNPAELLVMGANPNRGRSMANPLGAFTVKEKMHLGMLGIKWGGIRTKRDVNRARRALRQFGALKHLYNPHAEAARNPIDGVISGSEDSQLAREIYEGFRAIKVDKVIVGNDPQIPGGKYAFLGALFSLDVKPPAGAPDRFVKNLSPGPGIRVISDVSRRQLYFSGGRQTLTAPQLASFGCGPENICELGEVRVIRYVAEKYHAQLAPEDRGEEITWVHKFGEKSGIRPTLFYDRSMCRLILHGGEYEVLDEGIVN